MKAKTFKVNAEQVNVLSITGEAVVLKQNEKREVAEFNPNSLIVLSSNGKQGKLKSGVIGWLYSPSIEFLDGDAPEPILEKPVLSLDSKEIKKDK